MPIKASVNIEDAEGRPAFTKQSLSNPNGMKMIRDTTLNGVLQKKMHEYYRLIAGIDICIGKIVASLKEHGLDENTVDYLHLRPRALSR